jgi:hypothetical protein
MEGLVAKEDYEKVLRSYHEYIGQIKSNKRDEAAKVIESFIYLPL